MKYISKTFLISVSVFIFCAFGQGMAVRVNLQDNARDTEGGSTTGEGLNLNEASLSNHLQRMNQAFEDEDHQFNVTNSSVMLGPIGARRYWFYSIIAAAADYYEDRQKLVMQVEEWGIDQLKLAHPIHEGTVLKTFNRAVNAFQEITKQSLSEGPMVLNDDEVDKLLASKGTMWGFVDPSDRKALIMDGNGRSAALQWAFLSQCLSDLKVKVRLPVHVFFATDPDVHQLIHYLMQGLYDCTDQKAHSDYLDQYFRTGAECTEPLFGSCENALRLRTSEGKKKAYSTAAKCMTNFASKLNDTTTADANPGIQSMDAKSKCNWAGFMTYLTKKHPDFTKHYARAVLNRDRHGATYFIDCASLHRDECAIKGINKGRLR